MLGDLLMGILTGIITNRIDGNETIEVKDKIESCYNNAAKDFYKKYGNIYGDRLSSFLERQSNIEAVKKSFNYTHEPLSYEDFDPKSFDEFDNPSKEAVVDFINIFRLHVLNDFELNRLLTEKEHILESKQLICNVENIKEEMVSKYEFKEGNKQILHQMSEMMKLMQINDMDTINSKKNTLFPNHIKELLIENSLDISEKSITSIINSDGKISGELIVKYNDFLSSFKNFQDMLNYSYYTQMVIELEPISFKLKLEDKVIKELIYDKKYKGKVLKLGFTSYGDIKFISETFESVSETEKLVPKLEIHPPKNIEDIVKINIESEDYDTILSNMELRVQSRKLLQDNHLMVSLSNQGQKDSNIFINFDVEMNQGEVIKTDIKLQPMDKQSALDNLKWLKTVRDIKHVRNIIARDCLDGIVLFEGIINFNDDYEQIEEGITIIKKILFIEKKLGIRLDIPYEINNEDIEDIENLVSILETGKIDIPDITLSGQPEELTDLNNLKVDKIYMFEFSSNDKYRILGNELDLGEHVILLEKVKIKDLNEMEFVLETEKESKKIRIYREYYGKYSLEQIKEKEGFCI